MNPASVSIGDLSTNEKELVRTYDRQRRRRLLILFGSLFGSIIFLAFLIFIATLAINSEASTANYIALIANLLINTSLYSAIVFLAIRDKIEASATLFTLVIATIPNLSILGSAAEFGLNIIDIVFIFIPIIVVSFIGHPWMIYGTTGITSLTTLISFHAFKPFTGSLVFDNSQTAFLLVFMYWATAFMLVAQYNSYQRVLHELSNVQIQIERVRHLDNLKNSFIRSINHELRTPIMTVLGYIDLLQNPHNRESPERLELCVTRAQKAGQALQTLLAGILDTHRLAASGDTITPQIVEILPALESAIILLPAEQVDGNTIERALYVHMPKYLRVWADPIKFQQILLNLLSNAIKYSDPGTPVEITVQIVTRKPHSRFDRQARHQYMVELAIRDHGLGIPPEQIPLLFQQFTRLPRDLGSKVMGTGLGLYLCRIMAEQMGGSITVESSGIDGEGSTFILQLPVPPASVPKGSELTNPYMDSSQVSSPQLSMHT
jgi:signal transduction histidine kinase